MPTRSLPATRPAAIIFDLDGTLVDTVATRIAAWQAAFAERGIPAQPAHVAELIGSDGRRLAREVAAAAGVTLATDDDEEIDARSGAIFTDLNREPRPLVGARDLLSGLDAMGLRWAIATSSRRDQVAASVEALDLPRPPLVVDGTHVEHAKPAPDLLLLAAERAGVAPDVCWYVGDATWDFQACVAAGMTGIAVPTGAVDARTLLDAGARLAIEGLDDLLIDLRRRGLAGVTLELPRSPGCP
jgi:HAD superfamily hydrolase (TIGR01509 family)